jgi:Cys-tRNA(Pro)/Cys-tRNA(Cys) deacylase
MAKKLNSLRLLETQGIAYTAVYFPETVLSATGVAAYLGLPVSQVYKTLVVLPEQGKPLLVMVAAECTVQLKRLAQALGQKKLRMATQREAEALTGLKVGGISALALRQHGFAVYLDRAAAGLDDILVSAGQRGVDVRLKVADLLRATGAVLVDATAPQA